ncbi:MAG: S66 peptidase family protein [Patescibacteria group bacterium]
MSKFKLNNGDSVMVISPSGSLKTDSAVFNLARVNFEKYFGLSIKYAKNSGKVNLYGTSSLQDRLNDLHNAFKDKSIKAIICLTGGYNSNDLLSHIDWKIIKNNPKPIIGSSDITVLLNAIYRQTGMTTYFGPNYFKFGMKMGLDYTLEYFEKALFSSEKYIISPSKKWSDDKWYHDQENRTFYTNKGYKIINEGKASGTIIGGNLCSLNLLQGTVFMPSLKNSILLIEDDDLAGEDCFGEFCRNLQSVLHLPDSKHIKGIIVGRFPLKCEMDLKKIKYIINSRTELRNIPVLANVDFGHTDPMLTLPIGGKLEMNLRKNTSILKVIIC